MSVSRRLSFMGLLVAALCAGCDGRGSSGFDITENALIRRVLENQRCEDRRALTFCPADQRGDATPGTATPTATAGPTRTPPPEPTPRVDTQLANGASIPCSRPQPFAPCTLAFRFTAMGFPDEASFRIATRLRQPDTDWTLTPVAEPLPGAGAMERETLIAIDAPAAGGDVRVQFAVIAYLTSPATPLDPIAALAQSEGDFAFVTDELVLELITTEPPPTTAADTPTPTQTEPTAGTETPGTATPTLSASPSPATPTPTSPPANGPVITYFGVARADNFSVAPSAFDPAGRPIYVRPFGSGFSLIVEGRPGPRNRIVGGSAYDVSGGFPDLQIILSRPIGDGSTLVCDRMPPDLGGVPATVPFAFSDALPLADAINDLGCRVDDGQGQPLARSPSNACTQTRSGGFAVVDPSSTTQFCLPIVASWGFPLGDTLIAARLRDVDGELSEVREIVLRNADTPDGTLTPTTAPATATRPPTATRTPADTPTIFPTLPGGITVTPTATATPEPGDGPVITHLGLATADSRPLEPDGFDPSGRPIYTRPFGSGLSIIVEAREGTSRRRVGAEAYAIEGLPDLQLLVSRPLGDGSATVCDIVLPTIGGVPGFDPPLFSDAPAVVDAINDLGCRVDDGAGAPSGRPNSDAACTRRTSGNFSFVRFDSQMQFCLPIAHSWAFPIGNTIVAARVRDVSGRTGIAREIVVHVEQPETP